MIPEGSSKMSQPSQLSKLLFKPLPGPLTSHRQQSFHTKQNHGLGQKE